jgi:hypothetical protein
MTTTSADVLLMRFAQEIGQERVNRLIAENNAAEWQMRVNQLEAQFKAVHEELTAVKAILDTNDTATKLRRIRCVEINV